MDYPRPPQYQGQSPQPQQQQYRPPPSPGQSNQMSNQMPPPQYAPPPGQSPGPSPGLGPGQGQSGPSQGQHLPGQIETYGQSYFGSAVPKAELSNPKGPIQCMDCTITIDGELVPVIDVMLGPQLRIYFEHHVLLWKQPNVRITFSQFSGMFKRFFAGMQIFQTEAIGPGNIAFSRDSVGQIVALRLAPGQTIEVREHQFVLATSNISYSVTYFNGMSNILFSRTGLMIDTFSAGATEGIVLLHACGNSFEKTLLPGEALDVEPGAWLWKDPSVRIETVSVLQSGGGGGGGGGGRGGGFFSKLENALGNLVAGTSIFMNRFIGPGRVGLQSMTYYPPQTHDGPQQTGGQANFGTVFSNLG